MSRHAQTARPRTPEAPRPTPQGGQALPARTQTEMSARFGHDFSRVRIHTDAQAAQSAASLNASAYALGSDVVFGEGNYVPGSPDTERLLAHELTHVVQQNRFGPGDPNRTSDHGDASEREAEGAADLAMAGGRVDVQASPQAAIARFGPDDYNPNPTPTLPDGPIHLGNKPADNSVSGPYAYDNYDPVNIGGFSAPGGGAGFGAFHGRGDIGGVPVGDDLAFANMNWGAWQDGGSTRAGVRGNAGVVSLDFNKGGQVSGDAQALNANAEASIGNDGATLGAGASLVAGSISAHDDHEAARLGLSYGVGMAGRTHWGEDKDGFRSYGIGADIGPVSFDIQTNDPLRTGLGMIPGVGALTNLADPKSNMTENVANMVGLSTKNADLGTTWDVAKSAAGGAYDGVTGAASSAYNAGTQAVSSAADTVSGAAHGAYDWLSNAASNIDPTSVLN